MLRGIAGLCGVMALASQDAMAQGPVSGLPNLVANGGFEEGTSGWRVTIGPYGQDEDRWQAAAGVAEVVSRDAFAGERCLWLNASRQENEVDVSGDRFPVEGSGVYLLSSRVRQLGGDGPYKVVIDWMDADGKHISYSNDWRGHDRPGSYAQHGGVFTAPGNAAQALVLVGVQKGVECLFDEIRLSRLPVSAGPAAPDGEGEVEATLPRQVEAGDYATFRLTYRAGEHGLPVGSTLEFRRSNVDPRWSPVETTDAMAPGYMTVKASNGALLMVQAGNPDQVPCVTRIVVQYPPLTAGDTIDITYGDTAAGSPGAQVQPKAEEDVRFVIATDGDGDGRALDLPDTAGFDVVPGPFAQLGLVTPVAGETGRPFLIYLEARDRFGNIVPTYGGPVQIQTGETDQPFQGQVQFSGRDKGRHPVRLTLKRRGPRVLHASSEGAEAEKAIVVSNRPTRPADAPPGGARVREDAGTFVLGNRRIRLLLPGNTFGYGVGFLEANDGGQWRAVGTFKSLGELRVGGEGEESVRVPIWLSSADAAQEGNVARLVLSGQVEAGGTTWEASVECSLAGDARHVELRCTVTPQASVPLRAFYAPSLYAGDGSFGATKSTALFPGLEYLTAEEVSSGDYGIVPPYSERAVPHPFKVTMPMMAVAADDVTAMLFWDPQQAWDGEHRYPSACFASPDRRDDRANHLLGLFAPSILDGVPENARELPQPVVIEAGKSLTLAVFAAALAPASDVTAAVEYWFAVNGIPEAPQPPRSWEDEAALIARGLAETAWDEEQKGWHNALHDPWGAAYNAGIALLLQHYAAANPQGDMAQETRAQLAEAFEAVGGRKGFDFAFYSGNAADALANERSAGVRSAFDMPGEGAYAFHPHTGNKTFSQAQSKSIGRDGEVVVGTCVMGLDPLLRAAYLTGDPLLIEYGERGLAYLDRFNRPQGAENWEVPLSCPNLRAADLACRCYLYGYLVTGKQEYLDKARFWATTGLPFIYAWNAEERPIMRYATISVMGTSLHTHTWFGRAVQWVGLEYAETLTMLADHDDSFPWHKVAEGILISAMQQQKTEGASCGHVGFYPDAYSVIEGDEAYQWCLAPTRIGDVLNRLRGPDPRVSATIVRTDGGAVHIVAPGEITDTSLDGGRLRFRSELLAGSVHEIVLARVSDITSVRVDGAVLRESELTEAGEVGWQRASGEMVRLRIRHEGPVSEVVVEGCAVAPSAAAEDLSSVANGGFEGGLLHWAVNPASDVHVVADAHSGASALELDATGGGEEVQCTSRPMLVEAGRTYELSAWVKQTAGDGSYKVTIDWVGAGGHIGYDNDWKGTDRPADYALHGGRFVAPDGARAAVIILGVKPGSECLFDDVRLRAAD